MQTVSERADEVLGYWFGELTPQQHFAKDDAMDAVIHDRFGALRDELLTSNAAGWQDSPETMLAAVIVLDQFSRNLFRGQAEAFAADPLSVDLALSAIEKGWHKQFEPARRAFLYMPLMHCEDKGVQLFSLRCFADEGLEFNLKFAQDHAAVIEKFGRYPSRNAALGRASTEAELAYLAQPGAGW
ncbi:MAG: DUF924 domain-containing protein [Sphingobium sp.]|nr:DUF924 domain-containing protein [Sphingobium sp.]